MNGWHKLSNESNLPEICAANKWTPEKTSPQTVDGPKALVYMNGGKGGEAFQATFYHYFTLLGDQFTSKE
jgi:hypothetical protein